MNRLQQTIGVSKLVAIGALFALLVGCTTYVEAPRAYPPPPPPPPPGPVLVVNSPADFYAPLAPYGRWVDIAPYGRCWLPSNVGPDWRPYCYGHWQRTDAGWYWVSDETWGWATYHYGRWVLDPTYGWVWVPQTQWAPAWVDWREGGGYCGWAPLPPNAVFISGSISFGGGAVIAPGAFVFVQERSFLSPIRPGIIIVNNTTIIHQTTVIRMSVVNRNVFNAGPRPEVIERATGRSVQVTQVRDMRQKEETRFAAKSGRTRSSADRQPGQNGRPGEEDKDAKTSQTGEAKKPKKKHKPKPEDEKGSGQSQTPGTTPGR